MKISIIIPCYNEEKTLLKVVEKVNKFHLFEKEIIIVDDFSNDSSKTIIENLISKYSFIKGVFHEKNFGKGYFIRILFVKLSFTETLLSLVIASWYTTTPFLS